MRIPLDATLAAIGHRERTVEGIRRLATQTAPLLFALRSHTDGKYRASTPARICQRARRHPHARTFGERYLERARATGNERAVFYVDNHMRTYTGQEVVRRGWRNAGQARPARSE